jgi:hypothetical protein
VLSSGLAWLLSASVPKGGQGSESWSSSSVRLVVVGVRSHGRAVIFPHTFCYPSAELRSSSSSSVPSGGQASALARFLPSAWLASSSSSQPNNGLGFVLARFLALQFPGVVVVGVTTQRWVEFHVDGVGVPRMVRHVGTGSGVRSVLDSWVVSCSMGEGKKSEQRGTTCLAFVTHYAGLPYPGSPLLSLPPRFLRRVEPAHIPRRGEGRGVA